MEFSMIPVLKMFRFWNILDLKIRSAQAVYHVNTNKRMSILTPGNKDTIFSVFAGRAQCSQQGYRSQQPLDQQHFTVIELCDTMVFFVLIDFY